MMPKEMLKERGPYLPEPSNHNIPRSQIPQS